MKGFEDFKGISLNGIFYPKKDLLPLVNKKGLTPFEIEILEFAGKVFDDKEHVKVETSGSTGTPKSMKFSKKSFIISARATNNYFGLKEGSNALLALPMRYIAGKMMVVRAIVGGYNLTAIDPDARPLKHIKGKTFDMVSMTPYQAFRSVEETPAEMLKVGAVLIGGAQISEALHKRLVTLGIKAYASFGMTETLSHFAIARITPESDITYVPLKGVEVKVKKNRHLYVKWKGITDGWLKTNDLAEMREGGFVWLGRGDHLINSGGVKVIPELVEKRLAHLISGNYFVAGIPHKKLGEEVAIFVETKGEPQHISITDVQYALSDVPFWQPRKVVEVDKFEYTSSGKVKRSEVVRKVVGKDAKPKKGILSIYRFI